MPEERPGVYVGCSYPRIVILPQRSRKGRYRATCSCGWQGPLRKSEQAHADLDAHISQASPAERPFASASSLVEGLLLREEANR